MDCLTAILTMAHPEHVALRKQAAQGRLCLQKVLLLDPQLLIQLGSLACHTSCGVGFASIHKPCSLAGASYQTLPQRLVVMSRKRALSTSKLTCSVHRFPSKSCVSLLACIGA